MTAEARHGDELTVPARGERLGPYRLLHRIGEGGMGVVHLGLDRSGRAVAVKVLRPHVAHDADARARLQREVETLSRVRDPRVAAVVDADVTGERPYIVTRYVPGPSLEEVVAEHGPVRGPTLLDLGRGLAQALEAIHQVGVVHRDLKPGNVLIDDDGEPVLIDFGIAHIADDVRLTSTGLVMGTPGYLSPELIEGAPVTAATDWWGWAATLTFAATGRPPFGRGPMDVVLDRVRRGQPDLVDVDPRLAPVLSAALSPRPEQRPSPSDVVAALERYAANGPATVLLPSGEAGQAPEGWAPGEGWVPGEGWAPDEGWAPGSRHTAALPLDADWQHVTRDEDDSDWEAAWQAAPGQPDPRIGRPMRSGTLAVVLAVVVALSASAPTVALIAVVLWCWGARFADRSVTALVLRRFDRGRRRSDMPLAVVLTPWHIVMAALATVVSLVLPVLVGVAGAFCSSLVLSSVRTGSPPPGPASAPTLAVGFLLGVLVAWWGPGGASVRRGSRSLVRGVARPGVVTDVVVAVLLVAATGLTLWAVARHGEATWWPFSGSPESLLGRRAG